MEKYALIKLSKYALYKKCDINSHDSFITIGLYDQCYHCTYLLLRICQLCADIVATLSCISLYRAGLT